MFNKNKTDLLKKALSQKTMMSDPGPVNDDCPCILSIGWENIAENLSVACIENGGTPAAV